MGTMGGLLVLVSVLLLPDIPGGEGLDLIATNRLYVGTLACLAMGLGAFVWIRSRSVDAHERDFKLIISGTVLLLVGLVAIAMDSYGNNFHYLQHIWWVWRSFPSSAKIENR